MDTFVELPYGGPGSGFHVSQLIDLIRHSGRDYIIQGQDHWHPGEPQKAAVLGRLAEKELHSQKGH